MQSQCIINKEIIIRVLIRLGYDPLGKALKDAALKGWLETMLEYY